jgi:hypothetical protein
MSKLSVPQEKNTIVKNAWASMIYVIAKSRDKQMANVSTHQLKPLELSALNASCSSDNKNGEGKPTTATISALRTNDSVAATTTIAATATTTLRTY